MAIGRRIPSADDYAAMIAAGLEEGEDLRGEVLPLDEFLSREDWGNLQLYPRQRLITRITDSAINRVPLDTRLECYPLVGDRRVDTDDDPHVSQRMAALMPHAVTWDDAQGAYVYDERADWNYLLSGVDVYARAVVNIDPTSPDPLKLIYIMGRGASKTTVLSAGTSAHQTYRILSAPKPHALFGLADMKPMAIQNTATSAEQAGEFFDAYQTLIERIPWFSGRYSPPIKGVIKFGRHLRAIRSSSNSKSARGKDAVGVVYDEMAFNEKTDGPRSDRRLYKALYAAVKTRAKGRGLIMVVSSPAEADGQLFELASQAEAGVLTNFIMVQLSTWCMLPGQTRQNYAAEYREDPDMAEMEYGAQFYSGQANLLPHVQGRIPDMFKLYEVLTGANTPIAWASLTDPDLDAAYKRRERKFSRAIHVDTSEGGDRMVLAMCHVRQRRVVVDLVRAWEGEVSFSRELIPFIKLLCDRFDVAQVSFDQFSSLQAIQDLEDMGITAVKTAFTTGYNDAIARNMRSLVHENLFAIYPVSPDVLSGFSRLVVDESWADDPRRWPEMSAALLLKEMAAAKKVVKGRNIAAVAPTAGPIQTDDALDAVMAAAYQAIELSGGAGEFFTLARSQAGLTAGEAKGAIPEARAPKKREIKCPHHGGWVSVDDDARITLCPECKTPIQVRL